MKTILLALLVLVPAAAPLPGGADAKLALARDMIADLDALRTDLTPIGAYDYSRALISLPTTRALAPDADLRALLAARAPGADLSALDALAPEAYDALGALLVTLDLADAAVARRASAPELEAIRALAIERAGAVIALRDAIRAEGAPVDECGALFYYTGDAPQTLVCDYPLIVSGHGDDTYTNRAGGNARNDAALAIDLGGDDRYLGNYTGGGLNGGGASGFGALVDLSGDDVYDGVLWGRSPLGTEFWANGAVNGGAYQLARAGDAAGVGLLLDADGSDRYRGAVASGGVNGGAGFGGSGALFDLGGPSDDFWGRVGSTSGGVNGGANDGLGLFFHCAEGAHRYDGYLQERGAVNGGGEQAQSTFVSCGGDGSWVGGWAHKGGVNGGSSGDGQVAFVWLEGDATFYGRGGYGGINGGTYLATAHFVSGRGDQVYDGELLYFGAINGGAMLGEAFHIDLEGDDVRMARSARSVAANGGGFSGGVGILIDAAGDDVYDADVGGLSYHPDLVIDGVIDLGGRAVNGEGGPNGCSVLVDLGGADAYRSASADAWKHDSTSVAEDAPCAARLDTPYP